MSVVKEKDNIQNEKKKKWKRLKQKISGKPSVVSWGISRFQQSTRVCTPAASGAVYSESARACACACAREIDTHVAEGDGIEPRVPGQASHSRVSALFARLSLTHGFGWQRRSVSPLLPAGCPCSFTLTALHRRPDKTLMLYGRPSGRGGGGQEKKKNAPRSSWRFCDLGGWCTRCCVVWPESSEKTHSDGGGGGDLWSCSSAQTTHAVPCGDLKGVGGGKSGWDLCDVLAVLLLTPFTVVAVVVFVRTVLGA